MSISVEHSPSYIPLLTTKLGAMLRLLNQFNRHQCPCSVVLQDFIQGDVVGLSLFVTKKGRPYFVACCEQRFDSQGHWIGGSIAYDRQDRLRETFAPITAQVAAFLHGRGYYGPAGVDVVTEQRSGEQLIIDLNVRVTGTFHLGPLRGHFTRRRMGVAALITCAFACSRDVFEESFAEEIQNGSLIVTGWGHDESRLLSHAAITVGAGDHDLLEECIQRTRAFGLD